MRLDIDGLRGALPWLGTRQAGGNRATRYEKADDIGMMTPADAGNTGEISRRGDLTAGQTAHETLSFRQFDQSVHPRPSSHQGRSAVPARCKAVTTSFPGPFAKHRPADAAAARGSAGHGNGKTAAKLLLAATWRRSKGAAMTHDCHIHAACGNAGRFEIGE
jgi:hypothetical protein